MLPLMPAFAALFVTTVYCAYDHARQAADRQKQMVRERVAELLWAVAQRGAH